MAWAWAYTRQTNGFLKAINGPLWLLISWLLHQPQATSVIVAVKRPDQLADTSAPRRCA